MIASVTQQLENPAAVVVANLLHVDTHVHLYPCYDTRTFFDAADANIRSAGGEVGGLCLTERHSENAFRQLREAGRVGPWVFEPNGESFVLMASHEDLGLRMVVFAGRQIITAERLEVLALCVDETFEDGLSIDDTIVRCQGKQGLAVLPWGFGKWNGERGRVIGKTIERFAKKGILLGDNAGRPKLGPRSPLFDMAAAKHIGLLPGSDPLPMASAQDVAGSYGLTLEGKFRYGTIGQQVRDALGAIGPVPHRFGDRTTLMGFVRSQVSLRLNKKSAKGGS